MTLLNIFHTGGLTLGLTIVWLALAGWMGYQAFIAHKSGGTDQEPDGIVYDDEKTPYHKIPQFWGAVFVTAAYVVALLIVASDYKGV